MLYVIFKNEIAFKNRRTTSWNAKHSYCAREFAAEPIFQPHSVIEVRPFSEKMRGSEMATCFVRIER